MQHPPIPANEMERLMSLSELDVDYTGLADNFKDLTKLAAKVAGTEMSLFNLLDSYTQWSVSAHNIELEQMPREESVCQYVVATDDDHFEVPDLSADERFKDMPYVTGDAALRYYYGVPVQTKEGHRIGALCVIDVKPKELNPEKVELLKIIADEIVNRLRAIRIIDDLKTKLVDANETKKKVAHDIRGPLGGIIGLAQVIADQGQNNQIDEVLEFINMIHKSGRSILELADEILSADKKELAQPDAFNLLLFKDKLEKLYKPQALNKNINFMVNISSTTSNRPFSKNKLLQITGNLISNALKFTPCDGKVTVDLALEITSGSDVLQIKVSDTGVGIDDEGIKSILAGAKSTTDGTVGEKGYGFGLALVKHLIDSLKGTFHIYSNPGRGATFVVSLPQN